MKEQFARTPSELLKLCGAARDGELTPEELVRLEFLLKESVEARQFYAQFFQLHAWMQRQATNALSTQVDQTPNSMEDLLSRGVSMFCGPSTACPLDAAPADAVEPDQRVGGSAPQRSGFPSPASSPAARSAVSAVWREPNWTRLALATVLAVAIGVGGAESWILFRGNSEAEPMHGQLLTATPVAYLASSNRCEWGGQSGNLWQVGRSIQSSDEVTLYEGVAEFRLTSGVSLSVEGPAALIVNSPTSLVVQYGKLTVDVPWEVSEFKVLASSCRMAAADAEFGVNVFGSDVDIHVFSGEVVASSSPFEDVQPVEWELGTEVDSLVLTEANVPADAEFTKVRVPGGRGLKLNSREGRMRIWRWHPAEKSEFTNKLTMAGPLSVARPYVEAVLQSKPVGYWRFESLEGTCIPNEVSPSNALQVVGNVKLVGDEENRVVDFGRTGSNGHMVSSEPVDALAGGDYSVEVWVKPSHYHRGGVVGMVAHPHFAGAVVEPANAQAFSVELTGALYSLALKVQGLDNSDRNRIRFLHRDPPGSDYFTGKSCFSGDSYHPRNWHHVVAVKNGSNMRLYVDGHLSAAAEDPSRLTTGLYLEVGQLIGVANILPFVGQLDELSIYNRAMNEKEIAKHFQLIGADPKSPQTEPGPN